MRYYLLIFLSLLSLYSAAQDPYYINYTLPDGLPSNNVYSVFQDDEGWIWFTTDVGIVKYDSRIFKLFNTDDGLSDNEVFRLSRDSKDRLWMHTLNGKPCFISNGKIYNEHNTPWLKQLRGNGMVIDFFEDKEKKVYISFRSGEIFMIDATDNVTRKTNGSPHWGVWKDDHLYAILAGTVMDLDKGVAVQGLLEGPGKNTYNSQIRLWHLAGSQYLSSGSELLALEQNRFVHYLTVDNPTGITNVCEIDNYLWIATRKGLYQYSGTTLVGHFFKDDAVSDMVRDKEGNYWVTTLNRGVLLIPGMDVLRILENKKIHRLAVNNNTLWLGGAKSDYYTLDANGLSNYDLPDDWPDDKLSCFSFNNGKTYIGAKSGIVVSDASGTQRYKVNVNDILFSGHYLYIATNYTARIPLDKISAQIVHTPDSIKIIGKRTNVLCKDDQGNIWIGTNFGLYLYLNEPAICRLINVGEQFEELAISIEDILFDDERHVLLVGTASRGLVVLKDKKVIDVIKTTNGLNHNTITAIKKIAGNTYLVGSNNGLNKVTLGDTPSVENYNFRVGLHNKKVNDIELFHGLTYVATDNGVLYFDLTRITPSNVHPACNIIAVSTAGGPLISKQLDHRNNDISISFSGISFKDAGNVEYYYRFAGNDQPWNTTRESQVNYQDLAPGNYTFELFCKNGLGSKSKICSVSFEILPPFWQRTWFIAICILLLAGLLYSYMRYRLKAQQRKNEAEQKRIRDEKDRVQIEKQMLELEQKALRMQMNPHFIFNALNTIKGYYSEGEDVMAGNYISKFSKLLRMLLNTEGQNTTLDNEIEMLRLYVELTRIRYHEKFDYSIDVDPELRAADTIIPSLLLQPLVENAIVHGLASKQEHGRLTITFKKEHSAMVCTVEDNGIGRKKAASMRPNDPHDSKAISIVQDRLRLFDENTSFQIIDLEENSRARGTKVIIILPIKLQAHENATYR